MEATCFRVSIVLCKSGFASKSNLLHKYHFQITLKLRCLCWTQLISVNRRACVNLVKSQGFLGRSRTPFRVTSRHSLLASIPTTSRAEPETASMATTMPAMADLEEDILHPMQHNGYVYQVSYRFTTTNSTEVRESTSTYA